MEERGITMKIAFARLNGRISLSLNDVKYTRGTRLRLGIFNSWIENGFELKLYSETTREKPSLFSKSKYTKIS